MRSPSLFEGAAVYLKRLEILGFKTFANRTVIEFPAGITAIVGPNGSGKSNVTDAIRWVLGEQSFSALRCRRTEDLIYGGGGKRAPLGLAEVSLTIDNSDRTLALPYDEVTLTRRSHRSGENEYFINKNKVRLRDIQEATAPLAQSYTLMNQGMVDAALTLRPDERRSLFEDAAEISVSVMRRAEAERRLRQTVDNLERLNDVLAELTPRLRTLKRQAREAEQVQDLEAELTRLQTSYFRQQWQSAQAAVSASAASVAEQQQALAQAQADQQTLATELEATRQAVVDSHQHLKAQEAALQASTAALSQSERELAVARERQFAAAQRSAEAATLAETLEAEADQHTAARAALQERLATAEATLAALQQELGALEASEAAGVEERRATARQLDQAREQALASQAALHAAQRQLEQLRQRAQQLASETDSAAAEVAAIADRLAAQRVERNASAAAAAAAEHVVALTVETEAKAQEHLDAARKARQALEQQLVAARRQVDTLSSRLEALRRTAASGAGMFNGVRAAMQWAERSQHAAALVSSIIEVPAELETALEVALGGRLQNIVVDEWSVAEAAIAELKRSDAGRATFLPLDTLRPPRQLSAPHGAGIVGVASELVSFDPRYAQAAQYLLSRTLIVDTLATARRTLRDIDSGWTLITLGGEQVSTAGAMTGGGRIRETGTLRRERELRELPEQLTAAQEQLAALEAAEQQAQQEQRQTEDALRQATQELRQARQILQRNTDTAADQQRQFSRIEQEAAWQEQRHAASAAELAQASSAVAQHATTLEHLQQELAQAQQAVQQAQASFDAAQAAGTAGEARLLAARSAVASQEAELRASHTALREHHSVVQRHTHQLQQLQQRREGLEQEAAALVEQVAALEATYAEHNQASATLYAAYAPLRQGQQDAEATLDSLEQRERAAAQTTLRCQTELGRAETSAAQASARRDHVWERCAEENIDIEQLASAPAEPEAVESDAAPADAASVEQLRQRLRRMGPINPLAPQEYAETIERHGFLEHQISDVQQAAQTLRELISELETAMAQRFSATFEAVAAEFSATFTRLFGGGSAQLVLGDDQGIEIIAQPPGKRRQPLSLLSGGERSMTAVALLVALLRVNPTPFCVMDEVDAALDEANVVRFREVLRGLSEQTQFIVVTHNRGTVEVASTLYGVTMQPDGASKLLSLQIDDLVETEAGAVTYISTNL